MVKEVTIFTDGACSGNPGAGGYGAILRYEGTEREITGGFALTTNNRMELLGVIEAITLLKEPCTVTVYTDSQYVHHAIEKKWLVSWKKNGWRTSAKKPVKNQDLWQRLDALVQKHSIRFVWVRGHAGHAENERCDVLARSFASQQKLLIDEGYQPEP